MGVILIDRAFPDGFEVQLERDRFSIGGTKLPYWFWGFITQPDGYTHNISLGNYRKVAESHLKRNLEELRRYYFRPNALERVFEGVLED